MKIFETISVGGKLLPFETYRPFADLPERKPAAKTAAVLIANGEQRLGEEYPILKATDYLRYFREGNRSVYEKAYFERRAMVIDLLLAEYAENAGRFADKLADGVWHILEETTWVVPAHMKTANGLTGEFRQDVTILDLFSACTASVLAWALRLCGGALDEVEPVLRERILYELDRRIFRPFLECGGANWWTGFSGRKVNNWNPWIVSNVLDAAALCVEDAGRREAVAGRALRMLDNFAKEYLPDGGCDEGPGYWTAAGASYFDALEVLYDMTGGRIDVFDVPLVRRMGEYIMNAHISGEYFVNFADAHARLKLDGAMAARFGRRTGSRRLENFGAEMLRQNGPLGAGYSHPYRSVKNLHDSPAAARGYTPAESVWLDGICVMAQRQFPQADKGLYLAVKGGHNAESHNHNDVGSFIVYADGEPLVIDAGVETYRRETFSPERYGIWTMRSAYHNLPVFNGVEQRAGKQYAAENAAYNEEERSLSMDLTAAYPDEAGLGSYTRRAALTGGAAVITDSIRFNAPGGAVFHILLSDEPQFAGAGLVRLARGHTLTYDKALTAAVEAVELTDENLRRDWRRERLFRLKLAAGGIENAVYRTVIE